MIVLPNPRQYPNAYSTEAKVGNFEFALYQRYTGSTIGKIILLVKLQ